MRISAGGFPLKSARPPLTLRSIFRTWWPLAASWMLMAAELPALSAVIARLPQPEINLAAYGGVVFPLALIIESPIIMLLAASTALCKDYASYLKVRRFMMVAGAALTGLHVLVAFTPLYYVVVKGILGVPDVIVEPARIGLMIMTPWTWSIAYRRFQQGILIRFGHSRAVGMGSVIRLSADGLVLATGYLIGSIPGIVVATAAVSAGVISEAVYAGLRVRPVVRNQVVPAEPVQPVLTYRAFFSFYIPLVFTSLLTLLAQPIGSAALSRMPEALASLAVWPVLSGLVFIVRGSGVAYNEVVVALLDQAGSLRSLRRFAGLLAGVTTAALLLLAATPLSRLWFEGVSALPPHLAGLAQAGLWLALPMPLLSVMQSWFQGMILYGRRTRGITEAVAIYLATSAVTLTVGVLWGGVPGLFIGMAALVLSSATQDAWLWLRSRPVFAALRLREASVALE
jgi:progressive ankylosis protein